MQLDWPSAAVIVTIISAALAFVWKLFPKSENTNLTDRISNLENEVKNISRMQTELKDNMRSHITDSKHNYERLEAKIDTLNDLLLKYISSRE